MLAGDILAEAADYSIDFDPRATGGAKAGLSKLLQIWRQLYVEIARSNPGPLSEQRLISIDDDFFDELQANQGYIEIPRLITVANMIALDEGGRSTLVYQIAREQQYPADPTSVLWPSVVIDPAKLWPTSPSRLGSDRTWDAWELIEYFAVPMPDYIKSVKTELDAPESLRGAMVERLAEWYAVRSGDVALASLLAGKRAEQVLNYLDGAAALLDQGATYQLGATGGYQ